MLKEQYQEMGISTEVLTIVKKYALALRIDLRG